MIRYYAIFDNSLQQANPPFSCSDDKSAVRMVRNMLVSASDDVFKRVVPVCDLRFVGTFDDIKSVFNSDVTPIVICNLADIPIPDSPGGSV